MSFNTRSAIVSLRAEIAALVATSRALRAEASALRLSSGAASGAARSALNEKRRSLRPSLRYRHLALAFLRGRAYAAAERSSASPVDSAAVASCITSAAGITDRELIASALASVRAWVSARDHGPVTTDQGVAAQTEAGAPA